MLITLGAYSDVSRGASPQCGALEDAPLQ